MPTRSRRLLAPDPYRCWDEATVVEVWQENDTATTLRLEMPEMADFLPGQYYLVRMVIPQPPGAIEQPYSVSSPPYPSSREIEITVREVSGGRARRCWPEKSAGATCCSFADRSDSSPGASGTVDR
ncbi:MAG: hypothetical protein ACRD0Z_13370 [Acidimicrobiales bacterium]